MKLSGTVRSLRGKILCPCIELSLTLSLLGGQSFRWRQIGGNRFQGVFKERVWTLWSDPSYLHYEVHYQANRSLLDAASAEKALRDYFRLDESLTELYEEWSRKDAVFKRTCGEFVGIRMLNQDLVENLFSFLCSSNNNIARISGMIDKMCTEYGSLICSLDKTHAIEQDTLVNKGVKDFEEVYKTEPKLEQHETLSNNLVKGFGQVHKTEPKSEEHLALSNNALESFGHVYKTEPESESTLNDEQNEATGNHIMESVRGSKKMKIEKKGESTNREFTRTTRSSGKMETATNGNGECHVDDKSDPSKARGGGRNKINVQHKVQNKGEYKAETETKSEITKASGRKNLEIKDNKDKPTSRTKDNHKSATKDTANSDGRTKFYAFPTIESLAKPCVEAKLRQLGFGYRAKFIQKSAEYIEEHGGEVWLEALRGMSYEEARRELQKLPGIGAKVADCICLMSLSHLRSVPVDTHVYQIAVNHYQFNKLATKTLTSAAYDSIRNFFIERFGDYAGWAHSILFCADLKKFQTTTLATTGDGKAAKSRTKKGVKRKSSQ